ncbi:MAG: beta-ketoacyl-[acyl-carrier-protein] synthase II, partial [Gammaproteobacteria bacterium]
MSAFRCYIQTIGLVSTLGEGTGETFLRLMAGDTGGMRTETGWLPSGLATVGRVTATLPRLPSKFAEYDCRNNRLLAATALQIEPVLTTLIDCYGPARIGVILGTSTSGIAAGEAGIEARIRNGVFPSDYSYRQQEIGT